MIVPALDAGASSAGSVIIRVTVSAGGPISFVCLHSEQLRLELDGGPKEAAAAETMGRMVDVAQGLAQPSEKVCAIVEGIEGFVYAGRSATHLFDTADQAGFARASFRARGITARKTTAKIVRKFLVGNAAAGDDEVVIAVSACVAGLPSIPLPVPANHKHMHFYDAAAAALFGAAMELGWTRMGLPDSALQALARHRIQAGQKKATDKMLVATGQKKAKAPRVQSRGTSRRRSEAAKAAARRA